MLKKYQQNKLPLLISLLITFVSSLAYLSESGAINTTIKRLDALSYDNWIKKTVDTKLNNNIDLPPIIIIDIDEYSLKKDGRWPWSRHKIAQLVNKLYEANVSVIAFDVEFSEPERNPANTVKALLQQQGKEIPSWLEQTQQQLDADSAFAKSLKDKSVVLGYHFHHQNDEKKGLIHQSKIQTTANLEKITAIKMPSYAANIKQLTEQSAGSGFFTIFPDDDGVVRRAPVIVKHDGKLYPSLALEAAKQYLFEDISNVYTKKIDNVEVITHLNLGGKEVRTDARGQILIPYQVNTDRFPVISASKILHGNVTTESLEGAIVFIGTSSAGLADIRPTPINPALAGVKIQATLAYGLLHPESLIATPEWADGAIIIELILLALFMLLLFPLLRHYALVLTALTLMLISFSFKYWLWTKMHLNLAVIIPLLQIIAISMTYIFFRVVQENRQRRKIHDVFGQYVPQEYVDSIMQYSSEQLLEGDRREMSVLFSDIRSFTALSENLSSKQLKQFLNRYLTPITEIIFQRKGTIDKYVGDMVMAFWGAPLKDDKHAQHAVLAALEMQKTIAGMQSQFADLNLSHISAGIGIHTGEMNVGDMGSDYRRAYTVLGDAVNLGSRLESLTKYYGVKILISEDTLNACQRISSLYIDYVQVKGRQEAVKIYEPIGLSKQLSAKQKELMQQHQKAFDHYLAGEWTTAYKQFSELFDLTQAPLYALYLERVNSHIKHPPKNWDGIFKHTQK